MDECLSPHKHSGTMGGYKQSGIGRNIYTYGLDEYQETKQINMNLIPQPLHWFE
ncbi:acyl-CoA reductase-like NAD-dependent aldehyde dehydrogenase [Lysinibacillus sp. RC46]